MKQLKQVIAFSFIVVAVLVVVVAVRRESVHPNSEQRRPQETAKATATSQHAVSTVQQPHEKTPDEVWNEATPATRRSILASRVRRTWKNVQVDIVGSTMSIVHQGMDESGAQQIIGKISGMAAAAGLQRINFVRAGGMCQVTYQRTYALVCAIVSN